MSAARPPGWYDEPSGDRALLRWWDGRTWTSVTRQRAPFEQPPPEPRADPPGTGRPGAEDARDADVLDSGEPSARRRGLLLAGLAAAAVAVLLATRLPGGGSGDDGLAGPGQVTAVPSRPAPTTAPPVTGRIVDRVARLSYDVLPGEWRGWDRDSFRGMVSTVGYYRVTQERAPNAQTYWANVNSGEVAEGTGDLPRTTRALVDTLAGNYYPRHSREQVAQRALTVDGAPAYLLRYRAVFSADAAEGYSAKTEEVVVLVVDVGADRPSALYISLPDTVRSLWPSIDDVIASVRVER